MRICLITLSTKNIFNYASITEETKREYCEKHNYDFLVQHGVLDPSRHPSWSKILLVGSLLSFYDWVFWSDADSIISDYNIKLEQFLDPKYCVIVTKDWHPMSMFNFGNVFFRNEPWTFQFLKDLYSREDMKDAPWWEQSVAHLLWSTRKDVRKNLKICNKRLFNGHIELDKNLPCLIWHCFNTKHEERLPIIKRIYEKE